MRFADDNDEPRDLRPHEHDPGAEPPEVDADEVRHELAWKAAEVCAHDGATYATEFLQNMESTRLNAYAMELYEHSELFRAAFAAEFDASVRNKLRSA